MGAGRGARGGRGAASRAFGARRAPEDPDSSEAARARAIGLLSRRDLPRDALKGRLTAAGFAVAAAESAVTALEDERLVDDARYAEAAVASRIGRGQGPLRIALELRRLGVDAALIEAALASHAADWPEFAVALRRRRFGAGLPKVAADRLRQARFLLYRGFTHAQVRAALGPAFRALPDEAELELAASDVDGREPD